MDEAGEDAVGDGGGGAGGAAGGPGAGADGGDCLGFRFFLLLICPSVSYSLRGRTNFPCAVEITFHYHTPTKYPIVHHLVANRYRQSPTAIYRCADSFVGKS